MLGVLQDRRNLGRRRPARVTRSTRWSSGLDRRFQEEKGIDALPGVIDLAVFYGRDNLLLDGDVGWVPGNVCGTIVDGLDRMAEACNDVWRSGSLGELLVYQRFEQ